MIKREIIKYCAHCNDQFSASRPTASFCSNTCRTKACVKRKQDERAKADLEAQHLQEQLQLQLIADARRLKREQKAELKRQEHEKQAEIDRQAQDSKRIQDDKDAADLVIKDQKDADDIQKLKDKQIADEKQSREGKERMKKLIKDHKDKNILAVFVNDFIHGAPVETDSNNTDHFFIQL